MAGSAQRSVPALNNDVAKTALEGAFTLMSIALMIEAKECGPAREKLSALIDDLRFIERALKVRVPV